MDSKVIVATALNNHARIYLSDTTNVIEDARILHDLWPSSCAALGRMLSITCVMGTMLKDENEKISTSINGGGAIGSMVCVSDALGNVKGFCGNNQIYLVKNSDDSLIVGDIVGTDGYLKIIKDLHLKNNYVSKVKIQTGEISDDFAYYFRVSEQTPCIISSGVRIGDHYNVEAAGCFFIELLPNYTEDDIVYLENLLPIINSKKISSIIYDKVDLEKYLNELFSDLKILDYKKIRYNCGCSRDKFYDNLRLLPLTDLKDLLKEEYIESKCEFCNKVYKYSRSDIEKIINDVENRKV